MIQCVPVFALWKTSKVYIYMFLQRRAM